MQGQPAGKLPDRVPRVAPVPVAGRTVRSPAWRDSGDPCAQTNVLVQAVRVCVSLQVRLNLLVAAEAALVLLICAAWVCDLSGGLTVPRPRPGTSQRKSLGRTPVKDRAKEKSQKAMSSFGRFVRSDAYMLRRRRRRRCERAVADHLHLKQVLRTSRELCASADHVRGGRNLHCRSTAKRLRSFGPARRVEGCAEHFHAKLCSGRLCSGNDW